MGRRIRVHRLRVRANAGSSKPVSICFRLDDYLTNGNTAADVPPSAAAVASVNDVVSTCSGRHCDAAPVKHTFSPADALD